MADAGFFKVIRGSTIPVDVNVFSFEGNFGWTRQSIRQQTEEITQTNEISGKQ